MTKLTKNLTEQIDSENVNHVAVVGSRINHIYYNFVADLFEDVETSYFYNELHKTSNKIVCYDTAKDIALFDIANFECPYKLSGSLFDIIYIDDIAIKDFCEGKGQYEDVLTEIISLCSTCTNNIIFTSNLT